MKFKVFFYSSNHFFFFFFRRTNISGEGENEHGQIFVSIFWKIYSRFTFWQPFFSSELLYVCILWALSTKLAVLIVHSGSIWIRLRSLMVYCFSIFAQVSFILIPLDDDTKYCLLTITEINISLVSIGVNSHVFQSFAGSISISMKTFHSHIIWLLVIYRSCWSI